MVNTKTKQSSYAQDLSRAMDALAIAPATAVHTADELLYRCPKQLLLLRVHDKNSISPHNHAGFNASGNDLSCNQFRLRWRKMHRKQATLTGDEDIMRDMIEHVNGGWKGRGAPIESPWISSTSDFAWAIWEIARRLEKRVAPAVSLSVLRGPRSYPPTYLGPHPVTTKATQALEEHCSDKGACQAHTRAHVEALNFARSSSEVLWRSRILKKEVKDTTVWTRTDAPIDLPDWCFVAKKHRKGMWFEDLVWSPAGDSFYTAREKMDARRGQLKQSRG